MSLGILSSKVLTVLTAGANQKAIRKFQVCKGFIDYLSRQISRRMSLPSGCASLETKSVEELVAIAESVAILRPLIPYPRWCWDAEWENPDLASFLRQRIWQHWHDQKCEAGVVVPWYCGTRLCLHLGNDLSRQIFVAGCIDPNELAFLARFLEPGMTFLDVGANEGVYSVLAAKLVGNAGTVMAFEPSQRELGRLRHNLDLNGLTAHVFPLALADRNGEAELSVAGFGHEGLNTLGALSDSDTHMAHKETVEVARLDDLLKRIKPARLDLIKMDTEGTELRVLQGAVETLQHYRPVILFEADDRSLRRQNSTRQGLLDYLRSCQYAPYWFDQRSGLPEPASDGAASPNMVAVPLGRSLPKAIYECWPRVGEDGRVAVDA